MSLPPAIQTLTILARKHRLLDRNRAGRLGQYADKLGLSDLAQVRHWLDGNAEGISPVLTKRLLGLMAAPDMPRFGPYQAMAHLADGGMGRVWLASSPERQLVVVKTVKNDGKHTADRSKRFIREISITQQLNHPNIVKCLDKGTTDDGTDFIVLEYIDSGDLRELVDARKSLPESLGLAIMYQVADALSAAHKLTVVHRDLKPSNIFVGHDGTAKLADFGIARLDTNSTMLTMQGAVIGSPQYMSPEQARGEAQVDIRSDIYALGSVLFFCLTGRTPFEGPIQDVLYQHCKVPAPDVRTIAAATSTQTAALIAKCLAKKADERPAEPEVLRNAIENALVGLGVSPYEAIKEETGGSRADAATIGFSRGEVNYEFETIIADLSGRSNTPTPQPVPAPGGHSRTTGPIAIQHLTASLLAADLDLGDAKQDAAGAEARNGTDSGSGSGSGTDAHGNKDKATAAPRLEGDLATAMTGTWISLKPTDAEDPTAVILFARTKTILGKLRGPPVDICLRNYPVEEHKDALQRISRQHLEVRYDPLGRECVVEDLGGMNGTQLDSVTLAPTKPKSLGSKTAHVLVVAGAVSLWVRCRKARNPESQSNIAGLPPSATAISGLDSDIAFESIIITRPENRPEMAYAMVLRQITIGGPGSDLALAGARSLAAVTIAHYNQHWIWRPASGDAPWKPLVAGETLDCGGRTLIAQLGTHDLY